MDKELKDIFIENREYIEQDKIVEFIEKANKQFSLFEIESVFTKADIYFRFPGYQSGSLLNIFDKWKDNELLEVARDILGPDYDFDTVKDINGDLYFKVSSLGDNRDDYCTRNNFQNFLYITIINELEVALRKNGAYGSMMSGSGPTVFGLFDTEERCKAAYDHLSLQYPGFEIFMAHFTEATWN